MKMMKMKCLACKGEFKTERRFNPRTRCHECIAKASREFIDRRDRQQQPPTIAETAPAIVFQGEAIRSLDPPDCGDSGNISASAGTATYFDGIRPQTSQLWKYNDTASSKLTLEMILKVTEAAVTGGGIVGTLTLVGPDDDDTDKE